MEDVLTHELIHAYDNCRIKYDPDDVRMLACTEVFVLLFPYLFFYIPFSIQIMYIVHPTSFNAAAFLIFQNDIILWFV